MSEQPPQESYGYILEETEPGKILVKNFAGEPMLTLEGGHTAVIVLTFQNLKRLDPRRADDFMYGVFCGAFHMGCIKGSF